MKVIYYYKILSLGGVEAALFNRVKALQSVGIKSEFRFSQFYGEGAKYTAARRFVRQVTLDDPDFYDDLPEYDAIIAIDSPDLIEVFESRGSPIPVIYESHASYPPALERYYSVLESEVVRAIVVPSNFNRDLMLEAKKPIIEPVVIRNCIDTLLFNPAAAVYKPDQPLPPECPVIVWVGRLEDEKNPQELVEIAQYMNSARPDLQFLVVGDTWKYEAYVRNLKKSCGGFPDSMRFIRAVDFEEMPGIYTLAASSGGLLFSTSHFESAPMTFIEAMACGCPVLSSHVGGVGELIGDGVNGRLYAPGNIASAAYVLDEMTSPRGVVKRDALIDAALQRAHSRHGMTTIGRQYQMLLEKMLPASRQESI